METMKALILGYYGAKNLGDDMMLYYLLRWLKVQNINVTVITENPLDTKRRFSVDTLTNTPLLGEWAWLNSWFRGYALKLIYGIITNDILIVGGGDLIRDDRGWRTFWYTMEKIILAILFKKRVYFINVGIGEPVTKYGKTILKWALKRCRNIVVRDQRSLKVCENLNCKELVKMTSDIVIDLPEILNIKPIDYRINDLKKGVKPFAVLCLRGNPNVYDQYSFNDEKIKNFANALDYLVDTYDMEIIFIPFECGVDDTENSVQNKIVNMMQHKECAIIKKWTEEFETVIKYLRDAQLIIAMRLHAAVLAVSLKQRCIIMPYDVKLYEFARQVNLINILRHSELNDSNKICKCFDEALKEMPNYLRINNILNNFKINI